MTPAARLRESLVAVILVGIRLHVRPDPFDWMVVLGSCWALLPLCTDSRYRTAILSTAAVSLSALYLKTQILHMMAVTCLLP